MGQLGKAISVGIVAIFGYFIFKVVYGMVSTSGWSAMSIAMTAAIPITILAVGVASMLVRPSMYEQQQAELKKRLRGMK